MLAKLFYCSCVWCLCCYSRATASLPRDSRQAVGKVSREKSLIAFKKNLEMESAPSARCSDTDQNALEQFLGFRGPTEDCCTWSGVLCNQHGEVETLAFNSDHDIAQNYGNLESLRSMTQMKSLYLQGNNVAGDIESLSNMTQLQQLVLLGGGNGMDLTDVTGDLSSLSKMTQMQNLTLTGMMNVTGDISSLGNMAQMQFLTLGDYFAWDAVDTFTHQDSGMVSVTGDISSLRNMTQMQTLCLMGLASVTADLASISDMTQMQNLNLSGLATVEGNVSMLCNMTRMRFLTLGCFYNYGANIPYPANVIGDISSLSNMTQMQTMNMGAPLLTGDLLSLSKMTQMQDLQIAGWSAVTGDILSLGSMTQMRFLTLAGVGAGNDFRSLIGDISSFSNMTQMQSFTLLQALKVTGDVSSLSNMTQLQKLFLLLVRVTCNYSSLSKMTQMMHLQINAVAGLSGDISSLSNMTQMNLLYLDSPFLTGDLSSLSNMTNIQMLALLNVSLTGDLSSLSSMIQIRTLEILDSPGLSGDLSSLRNMTKMQILKIKGATSPTGDISSLGKMTRLYLLALIDLSKVTGDISVLSDMQCLEEVNIVHTTVSGELPSLPSSLQHLKLASNRLAGIVRAARLPPNLCSLDLRYNDFTGSIPDLSNHESLTTVALHGNRFTGRFPHLPDVCTSDSRALMVLAHENFLSGVVEQTSLQLCLGSQVIAVAGNFLSQPVPGWLQNYEPLLIDDPKNQNLQNPWNDAREFIIPLCVLFAIFLVTFCAHREDWRNAAASTERHMTNVEHIATCLKQMLFFHCFVGVVLVFLFLRIPPHYNSEPIWLLLTSANAAGENMLVVGLVWSIMLGKSSIHFLRVFVKSQSTRSVGLRFRCSLPFWLLPCWMLSVICCSLPGLLFTWINAVPTAFLGASTETIQSILPLGALVTTVFIQPPLAKRLASCTRAPPVEVKLLAMAGFISWLFPLAVTVIFQQNCGSYWWMMVPDCQQSSQCYDCDGAWRFGLSEESCNKVAGSIFGGVKVCGKPFDICPDYGDWNSMPLQNSVVPSERCFSRAADICNKRFPRMDRCSLSAVEILSRLMLAKAIISTIIPLGVLLLCSFATFAKRIESISCIRSPVQLLVEEPDSVQSASSMNANPVVRIRVFCNLRRNSPERQSIYEYCISDLLGADKVLVRLAIFGEIALAWGPIAPLLSIVTLLIVVLEVWCHRIAKRLYCLKSEDVDADTARALKLYMGSGVASSFVLCACHLVLNLTVNTWIILYLSCALIVGIILGIFFHHVRVQAEPNSRRENALEASSTSDEADVLPTSLSIDAQSEA